MIHLDLIKIDLPLKKKFSLSKGEADHKTNFLTILNNRYSGEASGSIYYGPTSDQIEDDLKIGIEKLKEIKSIDRDTLETINSFDIHPIARSALSGMVINYISGETKRYPWEILELGTPIGIKSSFTISIDEPEKTLDQLSKSEYPIIKIKMGSDNDIKILDIIDQIKDKEIRVDANGGWSCSKAEEMIFHLSQKGVKIIEQPTEIEYISEWKYLKAKSEDTELILDEGLNTLEDFDSYSENIDGVNIKMEKSGGIIESLKIAEKAREQKKKVMLGCMVGSSISIAQSVYLSSRADYYDLDGPLLLENDIAFGITYDKESIEVDREIIGGPKLKREFLEKYISE